MNWRFTVLLILMLSSCVDKIEYDINRGAVDVLAIDGRIVKSESGDNNFVEVSIQQVFNFLSESRSMVVVNEVSITNGSQTLVIPRLELGNYRVDFTQEEYDLSHGLSHQLYVSTLDGREYESDLISILPVPKPTSVKIDTVPTSTFEPRELSSFDNQAVVLIDTPIKDVRENSLLLEVEVTYQVSNRFKTCYVTESVNPSEVLIIDTRDLSNIPLQNYAVTRTPLSRKFSEGIYFRVRQYSIDKATEDYFRNVKSLLSITRTTINDPLNRIQSNISNVNNPNEEVYGYFYGAEYSDIGIKIDSTSRYCSSQSSSGLVSTTGPPTAGGQGDPFCIDCASENGVSTDRPDYW